jgi:hypothetical protein
LIYVHFLFPTEEKTLCRLDAPLTLAAAARQHWLEERPELLRFSRTTSSGVSAATISPSPAPESGFGAEADNPVGGLSS